MEENTLSTKDKNASKYPPPFLNYYIIYSEIHPNKLIQERFFGYHEIRVKYRKDDENKKESLIKACIKDIEDGEDSTIGPEFSLAVTNYLGDSIDESVIW